MNQVLPDRVNIEIYGTAKNNKLFSIARILIFEFLAALFYTYGLMSSYYTPSGLPNFSHSAFISLSLFLVMCLCGQLTGAHTNPVVTLALVFGKANRISPLKALLYMVSQYGGSFAGAAIAYAIIDKFDCPKPEHSNVQTLIGQFIGSFLFLMFLLIVGNQTTTFVKSNFWNYLLVPIVFYITRQVTSEINGLNPAAVLANQVFYGIKHHRHGRLDSWDPLKVYWAYLAGPVAASLLAALVFHQIYLPLFIRWNAKKGR